METNATKIYKGRCLCGGVKYEVEGIPQIVAQCHCVDCQRLTGAGHSTGAMFPENRFRLQGIVAKYELQSEHGNTVTRVFCPTCGSPILGKNTSIPAFVTVSLGTLEDSSDFKPVVAIFARNRKPWDMPDESIQTFEDQPSWRPQ